MVDLDQFYTNVDVAKNCLAGIIFDDYDVVLEPSAGSGSFYNLLPTNKRLGIDLEPAHPEVSKQNFFDFKYIAGKKYFVVGNPPFGKNSSLAVKFFNYSANFADKIAFIVPRTFRKTSIQNKLHLNFHLIREDVLAINSFHDSGGYEYGVPCVFQVWERRVDERKKVNLSVEHVDFSFLGTSDYSFSKLEVNFIMSGGHYGEKQQVTYHMKSDEYEQLVNLRKQYPKLFSAHRTVTAKKDLVWNVKPDFAWRRAGARAGEVFENYDKCPLEGFEFIKMENKEALDIFKRMWHELWSLDADPDRLGVKWDTAGQPSISKGELVKTYNDFKKNEK